MACLSPVKAIATLAMVFVSPYTCRTQCPECVFSLTVFCVAFFKTFLPCFHVSVMSL